ncbi:tetratricopeptide repeat protein [Thalassospira sp.]|uniref:tetratricopeptide repeat protein n=1 Tax=Thalassospira sp. TaxID=1912094 RepID=UPI001B28145B|nr:tetratricopeptide repeat protein [Thalassospira sp.]MBO6808893.1 hypothetical protein [Thalassospira sp.]MBO6840842.1 hypothetical protein [Thalassospira sp.]
MSKKSLACIPLAAAGAALTASAGAPVTVPLIAGALLTGAASNLFNKSLDEGAEKLGNIFNRTSSESDPIIIALRQAHLDALDTILKKFDAAQKTNPSADENSKRFSDELKRFIKDARKSLKSKKSGVATTFEKDVFALLPCALDSMQGNAEHSPSSEATATAANTIQTDLTEAVFYEVVVASGSTLHEVPEAFKKRFYDPDNGWFTHFSQNAINALKNNEAFKSLWTMEQLGQIKSLSLAVQQGVNAIYVQQKQDSTKLDDLSAKMDKILSQTAHEKGIDPEHIRPILERLGHTNTPIDKMHAVLAHAVDELLARAESIETSHNDGTLIDQAIHAAREKLRSADVDGADSILDAAIDDAQDQLEQYQRATARLYFEKAFLKHTTFAYAEAIENYQAGLKHDPDNYYGLVMLGISYNIIGQRNEALRAFQRCHYIASENAATDPSITTWQRNIGVSLEKIGDILFAQDRVEQAQKQFQLCLEIRKELATKHPQNGNLQRDVSIAQDKISNTLLEQDKLEEALIHLRASLDICKKLVDKDPTSVLWQSDLMISYNKIGQILFAQENLKEALVQYRQGMSIAKILEKTSSDRTQSQRNLYIAFTKIGDVLSAEGKTKEALHEYRKGMAIAESLAKIDPTNTERQRDLIIAHVKLSETDPLNVDRHLTEALRVATELEQSHRLAPRDEWMPSELQRRLDQLSYRT